MEQELTYPIGLQDFRILREEGYVYVDKTRYIEQLIRRKYRYCFLARPRRFGKSLFLSTLQCFFEGKKDLFRGLAIENMEWDWQPYPVLRLDLNSAEFNEIGMLDGLLENTFSQWEEAYGIKVTDKEYSQRLRTIIREAHEKTGREVVILVDEYDKPLVKNINNAAAIDHYRNRLASIYGNFKSSAEHIRMVFLTGVSRFSKLSIFSDLNNLKDLSFLDEFADVCGITEDEMRNDLKSGLSHLATHIGITREQAYLELKKNYDGYRFSKRGSDIYNPWSLLNSLNDSEISDYWNDTGLPRLVAETLKRVNADLEALFDSYCTDDDLKGLDLLSPQPRALLYQAGYLTIKGHYPQLKRYRLAIPNVEVKNGLFNVLLPYYVKTKSQDEPKQLISDMVMYFISGQPNKAMKCLQAYFAGVHYKMKMENENNFHNAFFILLDLIGLDTETESATSDGSIDITIKTVDYIYVIELKYDGSARQAIRQIEDKRYTRKYQMDGRRLIAIGAAFSSKTRCIEDWEITEIHSPA